LHRFVLKAVLDRLHNPQYLVFAGAPFPEACLLMVEKPTFFGDVLQPICHHSLKDLTMQLGRLMGGMTRGR